MTGQKTAEWFAGTIFKDEKLAPGKAPEKTCLPPLLKKARELEPNGYWMDRAKVFLKQGRLLADYEDDFEYSGDPVRYYPTYQSFTDAELRGYFSWRTKMRRGEFPRASLSFFFLYAYELINNIGVAHPQEGYARLLELRQRHDDSRLLYYLDGWLDDYVVYYNLPRELLADSAQVIYGQCVAVLERVDAEPADRIIDAVKQLAPKWLRRSRFYAERFEDMDQVVCRVLRRMAEHYAKGYKRTFVEQFFGILASTHAHIFSAAVFCNPLRRRNYEYEVDSQRVYKCENGIWSVWRRAVSRRGIRKLEDLLKTIDSLMREACSYGHLVKAENGVKWVNALIRAEIAAYFEEKAESERKRLRLDFSRLDKIREDAAETQGRLVVDEELEPEPAPAPSQGSGAPGLDEAERRLLHGLLYGGDISWAQSGGFMLSVLVDGINEKLYEEFGDSVLDDSPAVLDDYAAELKEMIPQ